MNDLTHIADLLPSVVKELLVKSIAGSAEQDREHDGALWRTAYEAGFLAGREVGFGSAHHEMAEEWTRVHKLVKNHAARRTSEEVAELLRRDVAGVPCPTKCQHCSVCIRAQSVAHRGGDYMGEVANRAAA